MYDITIQVEGINELEKMLRILEHNGIHPKSISKRDAEVSLLTKVPPEMAQRVWDLYQTNRSYRNVAALTGLGTTTVSRIINTPLRYEVQI